MPFNRFDQWEPLPRTRWQPNQLAVCCQAIDEKDYTYCSKSLHFGTRHHCRECGILVCDRHSSNHYQGHRVCNICYEGINNFLSYQHSTLTHSLDANRIHEVLNREKFLDAELDFSKLFLEESFSYALKLADYITTNNKNYLVYLGKQNPYIIAFLRNILGKGRFYHRVFVRPVTGLVNSGRIPDREKQYILPQIIPELHRHKAILIICRPLCLAYTMTAAAPILKKYCASESMNVKFDFVISDLYSQLPINKLSELSIIKSKIHYSKEELFKELTVNQNKLSTYYPLSVDELSAKGKENSNSFPWESNPDFEKFSYFLNHYSQQKLTR